MSTSERIDRALLSLEGLSVGDAFGERFFIRHQSLAQLLAMADLDAMRTLSLGGAPWPWTDDTAMALSVVSALHTEGEFDQNELARLFAEAYISDPRRGYGPAMHRLLPQLSQANRWRAATRELFGGQGSFGNGAAMRVAPVGAYFADDLDKVIRIAEQTALVTHAHAEGVAGAIAVAVATALAWQSRHKSMPRPEDLLDQILALTPVSEVASGIRRARDLRPETSIQAAAQILGSGAKVTAQDTVPFVLWSAAHNLNNFEEALWSTVAGMGDMDTTCAMVGGIVVMNTGLESIPEEWRRNREPLSSIFKS